MAIAVRLAEKAKTIPGVIAWPYKSVADAMEVIPRTLVQNCGGNAVKVLTELRAKHAAREHSWGIDGDLGKIVDMQEYGVWEPQVVKTQSIKTAIESACLLLRVDDVVSGVRKQGEKSGRMAGPSEDGAPQGEGGEGPE